MGPRKLASFGAKGRVLVCGAFAALLACSNGCERSGGGTLGKGGAGGNSSGGAGGGAGGAGGTTSSGGAAASGGKTGSGGTTSSGGASTSGGSTGTGGTTSSGGASTSGGSTGAGGAAGSGGARTGGSTASGGTATTGGSTTKGGTTGSGGTMASGGTTTGGVTAAGGVTGTGGKGSGGSTGTGGTTAIGGATGSAICDAVTAVASMKLGWNLGNSLDSADASKSDTTVETAWGNPVVTSALIQAVAKAGFSAVRIPVTWIGRFGASPSYTISPAFIARVEEVVGYVLDLGLYAIINLHHDGAEGVTGQWLSLVDSSGQVTTANNTKVLTQFKAMWTQIADRFKGANGKLIFEGMNEIKVGYNTPLQSYLDQINVLNQTFVDAVRATGGNNPTRCLVVPGYNTNIDHTVAGFVAPKDTSAGRLILSDHYYDPWTFAGEASTHTWGTSSPGTDTWGQEDFVQKQVAALKSKFIDKGLPVIWGEYGAVNQAGYESYRRYYMEYVTKATHDAGIVPFFWDRGATNSGQDAFGLINRSNNTVAFQPILDAMVRAVTSSYGLADVAKP